MNWLNKLNDLEYKLAGTTREAEQERWRRKMVKAERQSAKIVATLALLAILGGLAWIVWQVIVWLVMVTR